MSVHGSAEQPLRHHQNINERMSGMPERAETKTDGQTDRQTLLPTPVVRPGLILSSASASLSLHPRDRSAVARRRCTSSTSDTASGLAGGFLQYHAR